MGSRASLCGNVLSSLARRNLSSHAATLRDPDRRTYFKEEVGGLVFGGYEPNDPLVSGSTPRYIF